MDSNAVSSSEEDEEGGGEADEEDGEAMVVAMLGASPCMMVANASHQTILQLTV
jgi:hypothetical protein